MNKEIIKEYKMSMDELQFSTIEKEHLIYQINNAIGEKNGGHMKSVFNIKKIATVTAACLVLVGGTAFAAGKAASIISHNDLYSKTTNFDDLEKLEEKTSLDIVAIENFTNGYSFSYMETESSRIEDEDSHTLHEYKEIYLQYERDGSPYIYISTSPVISEEHITRESVDATRALETRTVDGVDIYYSVDEYLFLPVEEGLEPTEEEREREATDDHFFISYGSDERETSYVSNVIFEMDNVIYDLGTFNNDVSAEEMLDMAEEIVRAK